MTIRQSVTGSYVSNVTQVVGVPTGSKNVEVYRIDKSLPMPEYQTKGALAFDLYARIKDQWLESTDPFLVKPNENRLVPLNVIIKVPEGYGLFLFPRSSLFKKKGLIVTNSVGVIDRDYCGENDELMLSVYNPTEDYCSIEHGDRIAQAVILPVPVINLIEVNDANTASRGGFGSTG